MIIALTEDMARSTTDISDVLLERWLELRCCFRARAPVLFFGLELPDTIAYKRTDAFVDFDFTFLFIHVGT